MLSIKRVLLFFLLIFLLSSVSKNLFDYRKNMSFYNGFKQENDKEKKKNVTLKTGILKNSDPNEMEKVIRNKLNMLKANEIAVVIPNPTPTIFIPTPTPQPVYRDWTHLFFQN